MDMEENINLLKDFLENFNPEDEYSERIKQAIAYLLVKRVEDKWRIQKLEENNNSWKKYCNEDLEKQIIDLNNKNFELEYNRIPVQKVKEVLDDRKERLINGKRTYTNKIRINELNLIRKRLLEDK